MAPRKGVPIARFHRPEVDLNPQVMVTPRHSLPETLRFAEIVYGCVKSHGSAHINWTQVSAETGMEPAECMRLWRFIAYHWKGPFGHKQSDTELDKVDLGAESDPEGAVTHAVAVVVRGRGKRRHSQTGEKRSTLPLGALGFTLFSRKHRQQVKDANPNISFGDTAKELGRMWREMSDADKAQWIEKAGKGKGVVVAAEADKGKVLSRRVDGLIPQPPQATRPVAAAQRPAHSALAAAAPQAAPQELLAPQQDEEGLSALPDDSHVEPA